MADKTYSINSVRSGGAGGSTAFADLTGLPEDNLALKGSLDAKQDALSSAQQNAVDSGITATKVATYDGYATTKQNALSTDQLAAANSGITGTKVTGYDNHLTNTSNPHSVTKDQVGLDKVGNFKAVSTEAAQGLTTAEQANAIANIGAVASSEKGANSGVATLDATGQVNSAQLTNMASKSYVTDEIKKLDAHQLDKDSSGNAFATKAELAAATTFYCGGVVHVPDNNDYCTVLADENHNNRQAKYKYQIEVGATSGVWSFSRYNDEDFTDYKVTDYGFSTLTPSNPQIVSNYNLINKVVVDIKAGKKVRLVLDETAGGGELIYTECGSLVEGASYDIASFEIRMIHLNGSPTGVADAVDGISSRKITLGKNTTLGGSILACVDEENLIGGLYYDIENRQLRYVENNQNINKVEKSVDMSNSVIDSHNIIDDKKYKNDGTLEDDSNYCYVNITPVKENQIYVLKNSSTSHQVVMLKADGSLISFSESLGNCETYLVPADCNTIGLSFLKTEKEKIWFLLQDMLMNDLKEKSGINKNTTNIGDLTTLKTIEKSNLVGAINEHDTKISNVIGKETHKGDAWVSGGPYAVGDMMIYNNVLYYCIKENTSSTVPTDRIGTYWEVANIEQIKSEFYNSNRRTRKDITSNLANLSTAVSEQNLAKYGYSIGDYFTGASGYTYHLADMDTYYGGYDYYAVLNTHHIGIVVDTHSTTQWDSTGKITKYSTSTLYSFLTGTVLDNIKTDMIALFGGTTGLEHLLKHQILDNTPDSHDWITDQYISGLSECAVYGAQVRAITSSHIDDHQTGVDFKHLELFKKFRYNEIYGNTNIWLQSIYSSTDACHANHYGHPGAHTATYSCGASALILFY